MQCAPSPVVFNADFKGKAETKEMTAKLRAGRQVGMYVP
jgi:hypothetical protein